MTKPKPPKIEEVSPAGSNIKGGVAGDLLKQYIEQIEGLEAQRKELGDDIKEVLITAKGRGLEPKMIRKLISLRKKSKDEREEEEALLAIYRNAIGL